MVGRLSIASEGPGLYEFTEEVAKLVRASGIDEGLCTLFVQHTSASLIVQENADPSARRDLEVWLERLVPEGMPAHIRSALTATSLSIPILDRRLSLGTWQGIYLWEHRRAGGPRSVAVHLGT
jgi:secondary thiamine-phosphate synthase enzyme